MQAYLVRRLLALVPTLIFASLIVFLSMRLFPGDVIDLMLAQNDLATSQDRAKIEAALGFDRPIYEQYFVWIGNALQGDLGRSLWQNTPVTDQLLATLPITFELGLLATLPQMHCRTMGRSSLDIRSGLIEALCDNSVQFGVV